MDRNTIITIGRQFGSGGRSLGKKLAEVLGYNYYDRELLLEAAKRLDINENVFASHDEKAPSFFSGLFPTSFGYATPTGYGASGIGKTEMLYEMQAEVIRSIAEKENAIIVGRTADYILRDNPMCVKIFVSAPANDCVKRLLNRGEYKTEQEALSAWKKHNKIRASYYNFFTDKEWGAASSYDLCINSSLLTIDEAVELVELYVSQRKAHTTGNSVLKFNH